MFCNGYLGIPAACFPKNKRPAPRKRAAKKITHADHTADVVERKKGKWIWDDEGYHCSECWFHAHGNTLECMDGTYRFCPSCGAEMEGVE